MVMPELSYRSEQFYPHGLKSMSKGVFACCLAVHLLIRYYGSDALSRAALWKRSNPSHGVVSDRVD